MDATKKIISAYARNFFSFAADLIIPAGDRGPTRFSEVMADFQRERFDAIAPALHAVAAGHKPPTGRYWWEATKGASKDSDLAVALCWLLAFSRRPLLCQVGAADQDQADELRKAAKEVLRLNPWLSGRLAIQAGRIVNATTDAVCEIIPADVTGSHGARPDVLVINELSHVSKQEFAENLMDNATKVPRGLVVIATNAGFVGTWQEQWRENARTSDRWEFHKVDYPAPWLDPAEIEEARRRNTASRFARLWKGVWSSGLGDAIDSDDIDAAVTLTGPLAAPERGWLYVAALDIGLVRDASGLVVVGKHVGYCEEQESEPPPLSRHARILDDVGLLDDVASNLRPTSLDASDAAVLEIPAAGRLCVCAVDSWQAGRSAGTKVDLGSIERTILELHCRLHLAAVAFDPYQAAYLAERLRKQHVPTEQVDFTAPNLRSMASAVLDAFGQRRIELFPHEQLLADLRNARAIEKSYGVRLDWPRTADGHGDAGTALAIALHVAKQYTSGHPTRIEGPLICYP